MLTSLGYENIQRFHMNEGHASLLGLELLEEEARTHGENVSMSDDIEAVRQSACLPRIRPFPLVTINSPWIRQCVSWDHAASSLI